MNTKRTLIVGIGSPHGDDQLGWLVAGRMVEFVDPERTVIRLAKSPVDLLGWVDGVQRLFVCDACRGLGMVGDIRRWNWPSPELSEISLSGTHDLSLSAILLLGEKLQKLPGMVSIWAIEGANSGVGQPISSAAIESVSRVVHQIVCELQSENPIPAESCTSTQ